MSIGGPPGKLAPITEELIRDVFGLSSTHASFESDASPTRGDLYQFDNSTDVQEVRLEQFAFLYEKLDGVCDEDADWNLTVVGQVRAERLNQSVASNPDMFLSPFGGLIVQGAAHTFIHQLLANHTSTQPDGIMNRETLQSVFAVSVCNDQQNYKCHNSFTSAGKNSHKYKYVRRDRPIAWRHRY
jgi:hypothetical protein